MRVGLLMWLRRPLTAGLSRRPCLLHSHSQVCLSSTASSLPEEGIQIVMLPQLSPSMTSGKVKWLKHVGEDVDQYDLLFEVETSTLLAKGMSVTPDEVVTLEVGRVHSTYSSWNVSD